MDAWRCCLVKRGSFEGFDTSSGNILGGANSGEVGMLP